MSAFKKSNPYTGLGDSGERWHAKIDGHHRNDLKMTPLDSDPALYVDDDGKSLCGLSAVYVDDMLRAGEKVFEQKCKATQRRFDTKVKQPLPIEFTGFDLERHNDGKLTISENGYLRNLRSHRRTQHSGIFVRCA